MPPLIKTNGGVCMEEMLKMSANYGFPMIVAAYLLVRIEPVLRELRESIVILTAVVARQYGTDVEEIRKITGCR